MLPINPFLGPTPAANRPRPIRRAQNLIRDAAVPPDESDQAVEGSDAPSAANDGRQNQQRRRRQSPPQDDRLDLTA